MATFQAIFFIAFMAKIPNALFDSIEGSISHSPSGYCEDILISEHGETLLCLKPSEQALEVHANTGYGFQLHQLIDLGNYAYILATTEDFETIYVTTFTELEIIKKKPDGSYASTIAVTYSSDPYDSAISRD